MPEPQFEPSRFFAWLAVVTLFDVIVTGRLMAFITLDGAGFGLFAGVFGFAAALACGLLVSFRGGEFVEGGAWPGLWLAAAVSVTGGVTSAFWMLSRSRGGHSMGLEVVGALPVEFFSFLAVVAAGPILEGIHPRFRAESSAAATRSSLWRYLLVVWLLGEAGALVETIAAYLSMGLVGDPQFEQLQDGGGIGGGVATVFIFFHYPPTALLTRDLPLLLSATAVWIVSGQPWFRRRDQRERNRFVVVGVAGVVFLAFLPMGIPLGLLSIVWLVGWAATAGLVAALPFATGAIVRRVEDSAVA